MILVAYDSRKDKLIKVKNLFSALNVSGTTPEGLCFEAIEKDLIPGNSNQDSYFVNYSDGQPWYSNKDIYYSGRTAESHTRKMVNNMKAKGINVLSYFISEYRDDCDSFTNMYGKDAEFINATNMMQVAKTMNKKFLSK
jgi:nitric oxide reductase activation protein